MVSNDYLNKVGFATIRRDIDDTSDTAMDALLSDYIEEARADMELKGVTGVDDESDVAVRCCICSFVRWKFAYSTNDGANNLEDYRLQVDELRKSR